ncbi:hypothetical protein KC727_01170 [Candidatus Kaiserbacteria bacterium]|nr:hypothetical protein [Candidatus Kaiserbacteria bacterium]
MRLLLYYRNTRGITAVEALVGITIVAMVLVFGAHTVIRFLTVGGEVGEKTQALYLAEEGLEMVKFIRDVEWDTIAGLTDGATYYLSVSGVSVVVSGTPETIGIFSRSFVVEPVERNADDDIVASGTDDDDSKYVTVTVSWGSPAQSLSFTTIVADINNP